MYLGMEFLVQLSKKLKIPFKENKSISTCSEIVCPPADSSGETAGKSKEISQKGSTVVETPLHTWQEITLELDKIVPT